MKFATCCSLSYWRPSRMRDSRRVMRFVILLCLFILSYCWFFAATFAPDETRPNDTGVVPDVPLGSNSMDSASSTGSSQPVIPYLFEDDPSFVDGLSVSCKDALKFGSAASCRRVIIDVGRRLSEQYMLRFNATSEILLKESYRTRDSPFLSSRVFITCQHMQVMHNTDPIDPDGLIPLQESASGGWRFRIDRHGGIWMLRPCRDDELFEGNIRGCHIWSYTPYRNLQEPKPKRGHRILAPG